MKRIIASAAIALLLGSAPGYAAEPVAGWQEKLEKRGYTVGEPAQEIRDYKIDGWNYLDSTHLTINGGPGDRYLITLKTRCSDLGSTETIGFSTTVNRLTRFDKVVVRGAGGIQRDCIIDTIHKLDKKS